MVPGGGCPRESLNPHGYIYGCCCQPFLPMHNIIGSGFNHEPSSATQARVPGCRCVCGWMGGGGTHTLGCRLRDNGRGEMMG